MSSPRTTEESPAPKQSKELEGVVVSDKMKDTVVVRISRFARHPRYRKFVSQSKRLKAHDEGNQLRVGDRVVIRESRPLSKEKHFVARSLTGSEGNDKEV